MSLLKEVRSDNTSKILELLQSKPDLTLTDKAGNTLLHLAVTNQNEVVIKQLLVANNGQMNINASNEEGISPLSLAITQNYNDGVEALIHGGADVNVLSGGGLTPLHYCAECNNIEAAKLLIKKKADPNVQSPMGSPLCLATLTNSDEVALYLLELKSLDLTIKDERGDTFLHIAVKTNAQNVLQKFFAEDIEQFKEQDVDIPEILNTTNNEGNTILHVAELLEKTTMATFLRNKAVPLGLDPEIKNTRGKTAENCHKDIIENRKAEEEKRKAEKEESKEAKKQRKILKEQLDEDRRVEEAAARIKEEKKLKAAAKAYETTQKYGSYVIIAMILLAFVGIYFMFQWAIEAKKDNILDL